MERARPGPRGQVVGLLVVLATLACSLLPAGGRPATPGPATPGLATPAPATAGTATPTTPASAPRTDVTVQQEVTFGAGPFVLADPKVGLAALASYTATLTVAFAGTDNGQPAHWSRQYVMVASRQPAVRQLTIQNTGDVSDTEPVYLAELDGAEYEQSGQDSCSAHASVAGAALSDQLEPARFLPFVFGAEAAGSQTVNNVAAQHYTFDERALGQAGLTQSSGELWLAADGGYLVKYVLMSKAGADYFGQGIVGALTEDYEVTGVGQPVAVQLPAGCPGGMISAPLLPGATGEINVPGLLSYNTSTSLADAAAFYQKQLPNLGWTASGDPDLSDADATLEFVKGDQSLTVAISTAGGATSVVLLLTRPAPGG